MAQAKSIAALLLAMLADNVLAHTQLESSVPEQGADVAAPRELVLEFSEQVHVTAFVLQTAAGERQSTGEIPEGPATRFSIPIAGALAPGEYLVSWRAVSADTHIVSGEFDFVVTSAGASAAPANENTTAQD